MRPASTCCNTQQPPRRDAGEGFARDYNNAKHPGFQAKRRRSQLRDRLERRNLRSTRHRRGAYSRRRRRTHTARHKPRLEQPHLQNPFPIALRPDRRIQPSKHCPKPDRSLSAPPATNRPHPRQLLFVAPVIAELVEGQSKPSGQTPPSSSKTAHHEGFEQSSQIARDAHSRSRSQAPPRRPEQPTSNPPIAYRPNSPPTSPSPRSPRAQS